MSADRAHVSCHSSPPCAAAVVHLQQRDAPQALRVHILSEECGYAQPVCRRCGFKALEALVGRHGAPTTARQVESVLVTEYNSSTGGVLSKLVPYAATQSVMCVHRVCDVAADDPIVPTKEPAIRRRAIGRRLAPYMPLDMNLRTSTTLPQVTIRADIGVSEREQGVGPTIRQRDAFCTEGGRVQADGARATAKLKESAPSQLVALAVEPLAQDRRRGPNTPARIAIGK